jgi:hypothetical protein
MSTKGEAYVNSEIKDGKLYIEAYCGRCDDTDPLCPGCQEWATNYIGLLNAITPELKLRVKGWEVDSHDYRI